MFRTRWPRISLARKGVGSSLLTCHQRTALLARRAICVVKRMFG
jgi:hypothetical protein